MLQCVYFSVFVCTICVHLVLNITLKSKLSIQCLDILYVRIHYFFSSSSYIPKHCVSVPLQSPDDRHSLTADPTSMKPGSQVKMPVAPNVV